MSFSAAVIADHNALRALYKEFETTKDSRLVGEFINKLAIHSLAEELIWYPVMQRLPGGQKLVEDSMEEHSSIQASITRLQSLSESDAEYSSLSMTVFEKLKNHLSEEETTELPNFESVTADQDSAVLGARFQHTVKSLSTQYPTAESLLSTPMDKIQSYLASVPSGGVNM